MASGERFYAVDPSTGQPFAEIPATTAAQVAEMVADGHRALDAEHEWRLPRVRARALSALAVGIEADGGTLAELECRDAGAPAWRARADAAATVARLEQCAAAALGPAGDVPARGPGVLDYTLREPWGVCALVLGSWRPLRAAAAHALPALAAGNAVIVKPSAHASIALLALAEAAEAAGVPRGMLQVATGDAATGAALVAGAGVDHVTFAGGSAATGALVAAACADRGTPVRLVPAGAHALVAFADAHPERVVAAAAGAVAAGALLLVERALHDALVARLTAAFAALLVGPGAEGPDLGPLISAPLLERAQARLAAARAAGASVAGGELAGGLLMHPALVSGAAAEWERGAPVVSVQAFDEEWEAVALAAQATSAEVWTPDLSRAHRVAAALRAERVGVNGPAPDTADAPDAYARVKRVSVTVDPV
jgi:aldehyde dehydrogenase (NAD+)